MKIIIPTTEACALKKRIFDSVADETLKTGSIITGARTIKYLTHTPDQWADKVFLNFKVKGNALEIVPSWAKDNIPDVASKSYYIGCFTEVLLVHLSSSYDAFTVSK